MAEYHETPVHIEVNPEFEGDDDLAAALIDSLYPFGTAKYGSDGVFMVSSASLDTLRKRSRLPHEWNMDETIIALYIEGEHGECVEESMDPHLESHEVNFGHADQESGEIEVDAKDYIVDIRGSMEEYYGSAADVEYVKWRDGEPKGNTYFGEASASDGQSLEDETSENPYPPDNY